MGQSPTSFCVLLQEIKFIPHNNNIMVWSAKAPALAVSEVQILEIQSSDGGYEYVFGKSETTLLLAQSTRDPR